LSDKEHFIENVKDQLSEHNPDNYHEAFLRVEEAENFSVKYVWLVYESLILDKIERIFNFNKNQFGYRMVTSCKHASL
jgi:hypothetical protein